MISPLLPLLAFGCPSKDGPGPSEDVDLDQDGDGSPDEDDCDDEDATVHPGADETCNGTDDDCDGDTDEGATLTAYTDADEDGYGADATAQALCEVPTGSVGVGGDCDDESDAIHPDADETCDGLDNDCDTLTDEDDPDLLGKGTWYVDGDEDGFGSPDKVSTCANLAQATRRSTATATTPTTPSFQVLSKCAATG
jgi:hypothetical protein